MRARSLLIALALLMGLVVVVACDAEAPAPPDGPPDERTDAAPGRPDQYVDFLESRTELRRLAAEAAESVARILDGDATASGRTDTCQYDGDLAISFEYGVDGLVERIEEPRPWLDDVAFVLDDRGWEVGEVETDEFGSYLGAERDGLTIRFSDYLGRDRLVLGSGASCWYVDPDDADDLSRGDDEEIAVDGG